MSYIDTNFLPGFFPQRDPLPCHGEPGFRPRHRKRSLRQMAVLAMSSHVVDLTIGCLFWSFVVYKLV